MEDGLIQPLLDFMDYLKTYCKEADVFIGLPELSDDDENDTSVKIGDFHVFHGWLIKEKYYGFWLTMTTYPFPGIGAEPVNFVDFGKYTYIASRHAALNFMIQIAEHRLTIMKGLYSDMVNS